MDLGFLGWDVGFQGSGLRPESLLEFRLQWDCGLGLILFFLLPQI